MYFSDRVKLIRRTSKKDERGVPITDAIGNQVFTEETTEVWGDRVSPTRAESATAGQMGMVAEATVVVHTDDYAGQTVSELDGHRLIIYRTFSPTPDLVELHMGEKRGETGGNQH